MSKIKVAVCGTGTVGAHAALATITRDDLTFLGSKVYSESKRTQDVGDLIGCGPIGRQAFGSIEELIAAGPDCVVYAPSSPQHDEILRMLEAGIDVVTTAGGYLFYPFADQELASTLAAACEKGGSSLCGSGINPGFISARLPLVLSSWSRRIDRIWMSECAVMVHYPSAPILFDLMHFGQALDPKNCEKGPIGQRIGRSFEAMVHMVAEGLSAPLERIELDYQEAAAPRDLHVAAGLVKEGTLAAQRWVWSGFVAGKPLIQLETNWILTDELDGWPNKFGWTYRIEGDPGIEGTINTFGGENSDDECCIATAMQAVNVLPHLFNAAPGVRTYLDLPPIYGRYQA